MSNLEAEPQEVICESSGTASGRASGTASGTAPDVDLPQPVEILTPREVPLGGPRAMLVRRTLPQRDRSLIGAWCFVDHYGPDNVSVSGGMRVPPHPHTGLQTVSWLFSGAIDHRDSTGVHASVYAGELNLMTAGRGIQHSEVSTDTTTVLHGVQLWIALPEESRHTEPNFEHHVPPVTRSGVASLRVFLGEIAGTRSPVTTFSPLLGAQIDLPANSSVTLDLDLGFEHGLLVDTGQVTVGDVMADTAELAYLATGRPSITLTAGASAARMLLIGGEPLNEQIVMWWNFIGRSHDEIVQYRSEWERDVTQGGTVSGRFGVVRGFDGPPLRAPAMPNVRLRPRR
ncbi:pirin family protein [Homoserinimonas sp. OAct 916]|uniref:pirin family protein n=1 Tax=Homoserinimonas sp. OAct 916 TaxID=2211450 RepID=UPI000DBE7105|nr:pirin family protein [Homoserinimonas sp. OAct 916]